MSGTKEQQHKYYDKNRETILASQKKYNQTHKIEVSKYCKKYRQEHKDKIRAKKRELTLRIKLEVLNHYASNGLACNHCGFIDNRALSIDHINGGGSEHRHSIGKSGTGFYHWLKNNGFPDGYQVLCWNCQMIKRIENNEHQK